MNTQEAVKGRWAEIFAWYKLPPVTGKNHFKGECPICGKKGKFRIDDRDGSGSFICVCNQGDGWKLLQLTQEKDFKTLANEIDRLLGNTYNGERRRVPVTDTASRREQVIRIFSGLVPLRGTSGEDYLASRGITSLPLPAAVRFNTNQTLSGNNPDKLQALWALATDARGELCYLHRTLLKNGKKFGGENAKKMLRLQEESYTDHATSVAVRLFPVASTLGIGEGIETALAAHQITHCNTWATLNTAFMKKFMAPSGVRHLIIFTDADRNAAGHAAAFECAYKNLQNRHNDIESVSVRWPERGDFNNVLTEGLHVYEWIFEKSDPKT